MTTALPRSSSETLQMILRISRDPASVRTQACIARLTTFLDFEDARPRLSPAATAEHFSEIQVCNVESLIQKARQFATEAWAEANKGKAAEAQRTAGHLAAFVWALGGEHGAFAQDLMDVQQIDAYAKPLLVRFCELDEIQVSWRTLDDGKWVVIQRDEVVELPYDKAMRALAPGNT